MQVKDIIKEIEQFAPLSYQEKYDNSGLQVGNPSADTEKALLTLDVTEAVVDEAIDTGCDLIIAHHPLIFGGIKRITGASATERIIQKAILHGISIYAAHTNLDNVSQGVNQKIVERLRLRNPKILSPASGNLTKLQTYVPIDAFERVREALFHVGAGQIGQYDQCSFSWQGEGTFRPLPHSNPFIGTAGSTAKETVAERRLEVLVPEHLIGSTLQALRSSHPYEEVAYELIPLSNENQTIGAGMIAEVPEPLPVGAFLSLIRERMNTQCIRHSAICRSEIRKVAVCGGSGSFLLPPAMAQGADIFITADFKYHQFFDAEQKIIIADIGHFESEQYTIEIFSEIIKKKFPNFATLYSKVRTNPVNYYF